LPSILVPRFQLARLTVKKIFNWPKNLFASKKLAVCVANFRTRRRFFIGWRFRNHHFLCRKSNLPPETQVLLGLSHVKSLLVAVSLDFVLLHPYCDLRAASEFARVSPLWDSPSSLPLCSTSQERRLPALFCLGIFGLCLFLIFPSLAEEGDSVSLQWVSPLPEIFTLISALGLFGLFFISSLAGNISESRRLNLFLPPPDREERTLRVSPASFSRPQLDPRLPSEIKRQMESFQGL
jgi:hypothetical protein